MLAAQEEPTPTPTPQVTVNPEINPDLQVDPGNMLLFGQEVNTMAVFLVAMLLIVLITIVFVRALVTAGRLPPPAALVTALSVLTMLAIAGGIFAESNSAWTIAAAGIGALAGSVTAVFRDEASMVDRVTRKMEERQEERKRRQEEAKRKIEEEAANEVIPPEEFELPPELAESDDYYQDPNRGKNL